MDKMLFRRIGRHILTGMILMTVVLLCPDPSCAESTYEVYAYGSGDFLAAVFNGIAMITGGGYIHSIVKFALLLAMLYALMTTLSSLIGTGGQRVPVGDIYRGEGPVTILSIVITAGVVLGLFLTPKSSVSIIDRIDPQQSQVVANIPLPSAFIAHMMSTIGDTIGKEFETVFTLPDTLQFRNGGIALGAKYTDALMNIYPPNASTENIPSSASLISKSLTQYCIHCVYPNYSTLDGLNGEKTEALNEMTTTDDLMTHLQRPLYRTPNVTILAPSESGTASCADAIILIDNLWNDHYDAWRKDLETKLSGNTGLSGISSVGNPINLGSGMLTNEVLARYFPNSSADERALLKTLALMNIMRESYSTYHAYLSGTSTSAIEIARKSTTSGWLTAAKYFNSIVHTTRAVAEGLIYGLSVLLPLFIVFGGLSALLFYGKLALWLQMWVPIYVLINLYADIEVQRVISNILLYESYKGPTFKTVDQIAQQIETTLGYVGMLSPAVPGLAWGLVSGTAYAATQAVNAVGGSQTIATAQSTGTQVMGLGNISMGNNSINNDSIASSSVLSSQLVHQASVVKGQETVKMLTQQMNTHGGANGYINLAAPAAAVQDTQRIGQGTGALEAAGGDMSGVKRSAEAAGAHGYGIGVGYSQAAGGNLPTVAQAASAQGGEETARNIGNIEGASGLLSFLNIAQQRAYGATAGERAAADLRALTTGETADAALRNNAAMKVVFDYAKTLGAGSFLKELGFDKVAKTATYKELQQAYGALQTYELGKTYGYEMNTAEGRERFYTDLKSGVGIQLAVNSNEQASAINKILAEKGLSNRVRIGDVVRAQGDGKNSISIEASQGISKQINDHRQTTSGNNTDIHRGSVNITSGKLEQNRHHTVLNTDGTKTTEYDSYREKYGGFYGKHFNVIERLTASLGGGLARSYIDPNTGATVSGTVDNVIESQRAKDGGVERSITHPSTGAPLFITWQRGELLNEYLRRYNVSAGLTQDGMTSHFIRQAMTASGVNQDTAEAMVLGGSYAIETVGAIADVGLKLFTVKDALRMQFPRAYGPGSLMGGPSGSAPGSVAGRDYWNKMLNP